MRRLQKTIEEIGWTKSVPRFTKRDVVARAFDAMGRESHDCVLIVDGGTLAGIFTSRDFLNRVAAVRRDPSTLPLGDVMTAMPRTLRPRDPVAFAINWMAVEGFRNVPIVDDRGAVLGVLTVWDVIIRLGAGFSGRLRTRPAGVPDPRPADAGDERARAAGAADRRPVVASRSSSSPPMVTWAQPCGP